MTNPGVTLPVRTQQAVESSADSQVQAAVSELEREIVRKLREPLTDQERISLFTLMGQWGRDLDLQTRKVAEWYQRRADKFAELFEHGEVKES